MDFMLTGPVMKLSCEQIDLYPIHYNKLNLSVKECCFI